MKVNLMVDWREREILTIEELNKRVEDRLDEVMKDTGLYEEYLDDYLDSNYTKLELYNTLTATKEEIEETINDIRTGVAETIYDYVNMDISSDFHDITIEI